MKTFPGLRLSRPIVRVEFFSRIGEEPGIDASDDRTMVQDFNGTSMIQWIIIQLPPGRGHPIAAAGLWGSITGHNVATNRKL